MEYHVGMKRFRKRCKEPSCMNMADRRGMCGKHFMRWLKQSKDALCAPIESTVEALFFNFKSASEYVIPGRGVCYAVSNPRECQDFGYLMGSVVLVNGQLKKVIGVEKFMHSPPWSVGEKIGLCVVDP